MTNSVNRTQKTPEEIADSKAKAQAILAKQKKNDGLDSAKLGMIFIFVAGGYFLILSFLFWINNYKYDFYFGLGVTAVYVVLGSYYLRNPFLIAVIALSIFLLLMIFFYIINPVPVGVGFVFSALKIIVFLGLLAALRNSRKYKSELDSINKHKANDDLLDNEFMDSF